MLPLQFVDSILVNYELSQVLLITFVFAVLATLPLKSQKAVGLVLTLFGLVFMLSPAIPMYILLLGVGLIIVGPMVFVTAGD
ncbi:MAG: hypothetical protein ACQETB_07480 [Halobacteriota archaeon]